MKLIIQIPCLNEEKTLPITLREIPRHYQGIDEVEVLVIDDGSTDNTVQVARQHGADHIIELTNHKGLAECFMVGLDASLRLGADIIVNTDGDNQYKGEDIQKLIQPILSGEADMVIGDRNVKEIRHFSFIKKRLQTLGSWVIRHLSGTRVPDATSGFRAFSKEAALRLNVISRFTYTLETVIQAGKKNIAITHVPVRTNQVLRSSRLFVNIFSYIKRSTATIVRIYTLYEPLKIFLMMGAVIFGIGFLLSVRYLYFFFNGQGAGHIQSLILAAILMIVGFQVGMIGLLADINAANRRLIEDVLHRIKKMELFRTNNKNK
ncbi:glycosyltransferase family 2 protein [bacterium]|nr:glycosyltransferase family 2 protein [bacterium]